jgi:uncharacterized protein (DUF983 family)
MHLFFKTVPAAEVAECLVELAPTTEICSAVCPYCGMHHVFTGFSSMVAFVCRHCGYGVAIDEQVQ